MRERTLLLFLALTATLSAQAPLPKHARLEGEVVTPMLAPCANAEIELELDGLVVARTRADAEGMFVFPKAPPGFVLVRAFTDTPDVGSAVVDLLGERSGFATVRVFPARVVTGVVRDEAGKPVPGAWVGASPTGSGFHSRSSCTAIADGNGAYRLGHVAFGPNRVRAFAPDAGAFDGTVDGIADCTLDCIVDRSEVNEVEFVLDGLPPNAQSLDLRVRSGQDHEVTPLPPTVARPPQVEPGRWLVRGFVTADEVCAHFADAPLAAYPHEAVVKAGIGSTTRRFDAADPDARIRGIVRTVTGDPVPDLALAIQPLEDDAHNGVRFVAVTGADGAFVVQAPVASQQGFAIRALSDTLALAGNDGNSAWFSETHRPGTRWELTAIPAARVLARLVDGEGAPAAGVDVVLVATDGLARVLGAGISDRRGIVCIDGLSLGDRSTFRLECRGRQGLADADLALLPGNTVDLLEVRLERAAALLVQAKESDGSPAPGVPVNCYEMSADGNRRYLLAHADRNGEVLWPGLGGGLYTTASFLECHSNVARVLPGERSTTTLKLAR